MRRRTAAAMLVAAAACAAACASLLGLDDVRYAYPVEAGGAEAATDAAPDAAPSDAGSSSDADADADALADGACSPDELFVRVTSLTPMLGSDSISTARFNADERRVYFARWTPGGYDLYSSDLISPEAGFTQGSPLTSLNDPSSDDDHANVSDDENNVLFHSRRDGGEDRLYTAKRASPTAPFGAPSLRLQEAGPLDSPYLLATHEVVYVMRGGAVDRLDLPSGNWLEQLPGGGAKDDPVVSEDELVLYFATQPDGGTRRETWVASRVDARGQFLSTRRLELVNDVDAGGDIKPTFISRDKCRLYFVAFDQGDGYLWLASKR